MSRLLVVNPFSSKVDEVQLERVRAVLPKETEVVLTERKGHAVDIARDLPSGCVALYVFAGDGTYNEVLNGLRTDVPIGFIPGGGTSVLPRALGLPRDPVSAARFLVLERTRRIGLGRANGRRFASSAGIGLDAELVRRVDERGRRTDGRRPGDLVFFVAGMRILARRRWRFAPTLELDGLGRASFCMVANCDPYTYAGRRGIRFARGASFDLGLDVVAPVRLGPLGVARLLAEGFIGHGAGGSVLVAHDLDRLQIGCDEPMPLQVDGEDLGDVGSVELESEREAVTVLVP